MAGLERIILWILALILSALGMARFFMPDEEVGPAFLPAQTETIAPQQTGALPERVPGTSLQIQALMQYEGPYWEDGTGEHVSNVAALMLYNPSGNGISYGQVFLTLRGQEYVFEFTYLPAGGRLLVPEKNRLPYVRGKVTDCRCGQLVTGEFGVENAGFNLTKNGMSGIVLENQTDRDLENVQLYYKLYLGDEGVYVGGTTYQMSVGSLPAGGKQEITPSHFVWDYSAVVDIQTGEQ
ncbi:MAG: hypothetical protein IJA45_07115 [Oscillospiraceae bacterium]|nr:hypothetical protein [Oscillospiraceae bacterium]